MSTPLYRQTAGHIHVQQQIYKDKLYVYTFIQVDDWSYTLVEVKRKRLYLHLYTGRRLIIYSSRSIQKKFIPAPLYRQTTGHIRQQMYKDRLYVYTVIQADDWSCIVVDVYRQGLCLHLYRGRRLVIYSNRCIKIRLMSTPLYRKTTVHIQQQMYI